MTQSQSFQFITSIFLTLTISLPRASPLSKVCFDTFANLSHPHHCCNYPIADTQATTADHCYHSCFLNPDRCCLYDCMYREMQNFNNGQFTAEERVRYYDVDMDNKKISKDKWLPVVEQSVETCERAVSVALRDHEPCKMPEFMYAMFACEHQENFVNCPTFQNTSHCRELMEFVKNPNGCVLKYEDKIYMQQEFWFRDEIYEEGDNFDCIVWQLW